MTSPAHHRDLSFSEQQRVRTLLRFLDERVATCRSSGPTDPPNEALIELLEIVSTDETQCGGIVKTTRVVATLRDVLECWHLSTTSSTTALVILKSLVQSSHSRRSFADILPSHGRLFLSFLTTDSTSSAACDVLSHILLFTQEAKDVLERLASSEGFFDTMEQLSLNAKSSFETVKTFTRIAIAAVSVTPRVDKSLVDRIASMTEACVVPAVVDREELMLNESPQIFSQLVRLFSLLSLERQVPPQFVECARRWSESGYLHCWYWLFFVACAHQEGETEPLFAASLRRFRNQLSIIRKHNLESKMVQDALLTMHTDIQNLNSTTIPPAYTSFAVGLIPGGVKTLCGTLSTVDETVSTLSCAVLTSLMGHPSEHHQPMEEDPSFQFVALDGVLLLSDMLDDYSDDVVAGAFGILRALLDAPWAVREMEAYGVINKVFCALPTIGRRLSMESNLKALTPLAVLCCDFLSAMSSDTLSKISSSSMESFLKPWVTSLATCVTRAHEESTSSLSHIVISFFRLCASLGAVFPNQISAALNLVESNELEWVSRCFGFVNEMGRCEPIGVFCAWYAAVESTVRALTSERSVAVISETAAWTFTVSSVSPEQQYLLYAHFWSWVSRLCRQRDEELARISLKPMLEGALFACLDMISRVESSSEGNLLDAILDILQLWDIRTTQVMDFMSHLAVSPNTSFRHRISVVGWFRHTATSIGADDENYQPIRSQLPLILSRMIIQCEGECEQCDEALCTQLANDCFAVLLKISSVAVGILFGVGDSVLKTMIPQSHDLLSLAPRDFTAAVAWIGGPIHDSDDAHDLLIAIAPLLNGLLHQCPESRSAEPLLGVSFFTRLLSLNFFEVPLRMLAVYGLWNLLSPVGNSCDTEAARLAVKLCSWRIFELLGQFLCDAHAESSAQSEEALMEMRHGSFMLAERILLLQRSASTMPSPTTIDDALGGTLERSLETEVAVSAFIFHNIIAMPKCPTEGCSLLLCFLQHEEQRARAFHSDLRDHYKAALLQLHQILDHEIQECTGEGREPPSAAYYALLQIVKYQKELES